MTPALLPFRWSDEFTIGRREGDRVFSRIMAMEISASGDLAVLDAGERAVTVWDAGGNETHRWGGRGGGPGPFMNPSGLAESASRLAIADGFAVMVLEVDGSVAKTFRLPATQVPLRPVIGSAGRVLALTFDFLAGELRLQRLDDDEVLWRRQAENLFEQRLFRPRPVLTVLSSDRVVLGMDARYELDVIDIAAGDVVGRVVRNLTPRVLTPSFKEKVRQYLANPGVAPPGWSSLLGDPGRTGLEQELIAEIEFPDTFPSIVHVFRGPPGGALWIRRGLGVEDELSPPVDPPDGGAPMWDVFDGTTYEYLGTVAPPEGFVPYAGDATRLAGVQKDALDGQAVRVIRVRQAPPAGRPRDALTY